MDTTFGLVGEDTTAIQRYIVNTFIIYYIIFIRAFDVIRTSYFSISYFLDSHDPNLISIISSL